jgi:hypothetical protein
LLLLRLERRKRLRYPAPGIVATPKGLSHVHGLEVSTGVILWPGGMSTANQIGTVSIETTAIAVGDFSH